MALFDAWAKGVDKMHGKHHQQGDPLVAAAFAAFEGYLKTVETQHQALIAGAAAQLNVYGMNTQNSGVISQDQMAPLLALNLIA